MLTSDRVGPSFQIGSVEAQSGAASCSSSWKDPPVRPCSISTLTGLRQTGYLVWRLLQKQNCYKICFWEVLVFLPFCRCWRNWDADGAGSQRATDLILWHLWWQCGQWAKHEGVCKPAPQSTIVHKVCSFPAGTGCERMRQLGSQEEHLHFHAVN